MTKIKMFLLVLASFMCGGCASLNQKTSLPPLSRIIEMEDSAGSGTRSLYNTGVIIKYSSPEFRDYMFIVVPGLAEKKMFMDIFESCRNNKHCDPPVIMTIDAYADTLEKEPRPKPGPPPGNYATIEQRIAEMRATLKDHPALIYIYKHEK